MIKEIIKERHQEYREYCLRCDFVGKEPESYAQYLIYEKEYNEVYNKLWVGSATDWLEIVRIEQNLCI